MSGKINAEIEECVRSNVTWQLLPVHLKQVIYSIELKTFCDVLEFHLCFCLFPSKCLVQIKCKQ